MFLSQMYRGGTGLSRKRSGTAGLRPARSPAAFTTHDPVSANSPAMIGMRMETRGYITTFLGRHLNPREERK